MMMSKLATLSNKVPAHVARLLADEKPSFLSSGVRSSVPSISLNGREFTFIGTDGTKVPHDGRTLDVVIVGGLPKVSRRYFSKPYDPSGTEPAQPSCWSTDGRTPDSDVPNPQSRSCATCPMNEKGSHRSGMGKACSTFKLLAVMTPDDPDRTLYRLSVSGMSLFAKGEVPGYMNLIEYGTMLEERGLYPTAVVTRMAFSPKQSVPVLGFKPIDYVDEDTAAFVASVEPKDYENLLKVGPSSESVDADVTPKRVAKPVVEEDEPPKRVAKPVVEEDEPPKRVGKPIAKEDDLVMHAAKAFVADVYNEDDTPQPKRSPNKAGAETVKAPRDVVTDEEVDDILNSLRL